MCYSDGRPNDGAYDGAEFGPRGRGPGAEITFHNLELIKYFIQAIRNEAKFLRWRGQTLATGMTWVSWAGSSVVTLGAGAANVARLSFGFGTAGTIEGWLIGGPGGGDVADQLDLVADHLFSDLNVGSSLNVRIGYDAGVMIMSIDTGKRIIDLNCATQCAAAQMAYIFNSLLTDSVAWKYGMLSLEVGRTWNDNKNRDGLVNWPMWY